MFIAEGRIQVLFRGAPYDMRKDFDWTYNPKIPKRDVLKLATLKFIDASEGALFIGPPGVGKSHIATALAHLAVQRGYKVIYREARELGQLRKYRAQLKFVEFLVIDDLFLRKVPANAGDELADVLMSRYEKHSTIVASTRSIEDWPKPLGDVSLLTIKEPPFFAVMAPVSGVENGHLQLIKPERISLRKQLSSRHRGPASVRGKTRCRAPGYRRYAAVKRGGRRQSVSRKGLIPLGEIRLLVTTVLVYS